jgi:hypothetical protein
MLRCFFKLIIFINAPRSASICIDLRRRISDWGLPLDNPFRDEVIKLQSVLTGSRFGGTGVTPELETSTSESGRLPSFRDLTASLPELSVKPLPDTTLVKHLNALRKENIERLTDIADIEDGIN